jgi:hypothetical protein
MAIPFTVVTGAIFISDTAGNIVDTVTSDGVRLKTQTKIVGADNIYEVDTVLQGGLRRIATTGLVQIEQLFGQDPIPDVFFSITSAGQIGDQIRILIAGTNVDPTIPDTDLPTVDFTYTLVAGDVGDERKLAENIADALNLDATFSNLAFLEAEAITGDKRPVVHISSTEFSMSGEFHERPNTGDVAVTITNSPGGDTTVLLDSDKLISRGKGTSLARDPDNPHRLGILGISGSVRVSASEVDQLLEEFAMNGGQISLAVNPGGTPDIYTIAANPAGGDVKVIEILKVYGSDGNVKTGKNNFLGLNSPLTNGLEIRITKNGTTDVFKNVKTTSEFFALLASSPEKQAYIPSSGVDYIEADFDFVDRNIQISLEPGTTDKIEVVVQDNLSQIDELYLVAEGFLEED